MTVAAATVTEFRTPKGRSALMVVRDGTADHNNVRSCMTEDEYRLAQIDLGTGLALDVGAHVGGVTVGLALDNPEAHVIAIEALSANVEVLRENVERNGVSDRVTILHAIAGKPGKAGRTGTVRWNFDADESGQHHRYIANAHLAGDQRGESEEADVLALDGLAGEIAFAKIDCEGCEYDFLRSRAVSRIVELRGEFHNGFEPVMEMLGPTHDVTLTSGTEAFGAFRAVRR